MNDKNTDQPDVLDESMEVQAVEQPEHTRQTAIEKYTDGTAKPALTIMDIEDLAERRKQIRKVHDDIFTEGVHYGKPFRDSDRMTLLKSGSEVLCSTFMLAPKLVKHQTDYDDGHREVEFVCKLFHIPTGKFVGEGVGSCSTMESKYKYRRAKLTCPKCDAEAIIDSKYDDGFICWKKKGGCGTSFPANDPKIANQSQGRVENPDIANEYNTVLKMAAKRARIDATLTVTGASELYTQDLEDIVENEKNMPSNLDPKSLSKDKAGKGTTKNKRSRGQVNSGAQRESSGGNDRKPMNSKQRDEIKRLAGVLPDDRAEKLRSAVDSKNPTWKWAYDTMIFLKSYQKLKGIFENFENYYRELPPVFWDTLEGASDLEQLTQLNNLIGDVMDAADDGSDDPFKDVDLSEYL